MKTGAILNFWDCRELLPYAVLNWFKCVDEVIIIFSDMSNYEEYVNNTDYLDGPEFTRCKIYRCEPLKGLPAVDNERRKRNFGLDKAQELGITHFVTADVDEFYEPEAFHMELKRIHVKTNLLGVCCASQVYFKSPTLTIGLDVTIVPFIHKLTIGLRHTFNKNYPFAFLNGIKIDPTRQFNINSGVEWSNIIMHHYSYVRKDLEQKIRNSTARINLERSTIRQDFMSAREGYYCQFYQKTLVRVPNLFELPDYGELLLKDLQQGGEPVPSADKAN